MTTAYLSSALLLSVGTLLGSFPQNALAAGIGTTSGRMNIPRIVINRSSKDNGGSLSYTGAEYATHRPYKVDFDLLRASDQSHELEMPLLRNNDISDESKDSDFILTSDPTLRSRRRRRRQVEPSQNKVISATSSDFQRFNLCLPYFHTNPMCRQMFLGLTNTNNPNYATNNVVQNVHGQQYPSALAVPSSASPTTATFYVPQSFPPSSSISSLSSSGSVPVVAGGMMSRNDLAILNYYQQQPFQQPQQQAPFQQLGVFQGPIPVQRQRPQYDNIHTKYPYPYPPTLELGAQQPIQAVVPESGSTGDEESDAGTTDVPSDISQTTQVPEAGQGAPIDPQGQQGADQQEPAAPGSFPDSPVAQPQEPDNNVEPVPVTTLPPSSQPVEPSPAVPEPPSPPAAEESGVGLPVSPGQLQDQSLFQPPSQQIPQIPIQQIQQIQPQVDLAMQKRLKEKEEEVRHLKSQLDLSNGRLDQAKLQLEQSNDQLDQTKVYLEQAKSQLEEANNQLDQVKTQLEQANLQVVSYEQENGMVKDQFMKSEEATIKLRDRILQLENTNQHLQEQNGQLQQVTAEQRQQLNGLKSSLKQVKDQLESNQNQGSAPVSQALTPEAVKHRKEIEDFLIRIRKLDEENATCKKQVRLYQLKVNYIMEQQRQQQKQQPQKKKQPEIQQEQATPQELQEPQSPPQQQQTQPQQPVTASDITAHVDVDDDELDPELSRMDAEIAELQKKADEVAGAIQKLPEPIAPALDVASQVAPATAAVVKTEIEFPGEAVQVDPKQTKHKQPTASVVEAGPKNEAADVAQVKSASRNVPSGAPAWEQPAGF